MTVGEFLAAATGRLMQAGIESARLDALILLEDMLGVSRAHILAHPEKSIPGHALAALDAQLTKRAQHVPIAYIRGRAPFYGREFTVTEAVLVPRPESEALIDLLKEFAPPQPARIGDIGTGSGVLGITAALELPGSQAHLYDISKAALAVARKNAQKHGVTATFSNHDLLENIAMAHDILLANLPYVPEHLPINAAARHEPPGAIFSGPDGLNHYKRFWIQTGALQHKPALIITESLPSQHHANATLARAAGYFMAAQQGFAQAFQPLGSAAD